MDADCIERQRDQLLSRREKRWSMNSQRLEEIVAELMRPISDARRSFDTDLSALLEEYLTEAGLHALEAGDDASAEDVVAPNFAELALLLQQSANIYGRKVDFLYQHVLDVSDSLQHSTLEAASAEPTGAEPDEAATPRRARRRASTLHGDFAHIELQPHAGARRDVAPRPPPTLPRMYIELEPRVITDADAPLFDYAGEPIGLLADFQVTWRLHEGQLVDELETGMSNEERALRPISLVELQAAIEAAAPPLPPAELLDEPLSPLPLPPSSPQPHSSPLRTSTPLPAASDEPAATDASDALPLPALVRRERKRRNETRIEDFVQGSFKIIISEDVRQKLIEVQEFSIPTKWIKMVVKKRKSDILSERRRLREEGPDFREEFCGWSGAQAAEAAQAVKGGRAGEPDSDDDGFFEQSSVGESDASRAEEGAAAAREPDWAAWQRRVLARARDSEARGGLDVRALGAAVLRACPPAPQRAPFHRVLRGAAREPRDVSHLLLATLFLANAGNVELEQGAPLSVDSFSVRVLSTDERLFSAVAAADEQLAR